MSERERERGDDFERERAGAARSDGGVPPLRRKGGGGGRGAAVEALLSAYRFCSEEEICLHKVLKAIGLVFIV